MFSDQCRLRICTTIAFLIVVFHLIVCHDVNLKKTNGTDDGQQQKKNISSNETNIEEESHRKPFFTPLSSTEPFQSESKKPKRFLRAKSVRRVKKIKVRKMSEDEDEEDDEEEDEELINAKVEDELLERLERKIKSKKDKPSVKYIPIPVYMPNPNTEKKEHKMSFLQSPHKPPAVNRQAMDGLKALQMSMKNLPSNAYYGPAADEGYGYMPYSEAHAIQDFGLFGYGETYDPMVELNKKSMYDQMGIHKREEPYYHTAGYIMDRKGKDYDPSCDETEGQDKREGLDYYHTRRDYRGKGSDREEQSTGPPKDIMSIIANLNPTRSKRKPKTVTEAEERPEDESGDGKTKHLSKAKQIAQMLEMLDKMP